MKLRTWITWAVAVLFCCAGLALATRAPDVAGTCLCIGLAMFMVAMGMDNARDARVARSSQPVLKVDQAGYPVGIEKGSEARSAQR